MQSKLLFAAIFLLLATSCLSQEKTRKAPTTSASNMFLELGGNGAFLSLNYDQRFSKKENGLGGRIGIGFIPSVDVVIAETSTVLTIPFGLNYLFGKGSSYFEVGAGGTFASGTVEILDEESKGSVVAFVPSFGYRYQPHRKGFTGRVIISPIIGSGGASFFAGVSGGIRF